jgi:hypothetical protein
MENIQDEGDRAFQVYAEYAKVRSVSMKEQFVLLSWASNEPNVTVDQIAIRHAELVIDDSEGSGLHYDITDALKYHHSPLHQRLGFDGEDTGSFSVAQYIWMDVLKPAVDAEILTAIRDNPSHTSAHYFTMALLNEVSYLGGPDSRLIEDIVLVPTVKFAKTDKGLIRLESLPHNLSEDLPHLKCAAFIIGDDGVSNSLFAVAVGGEKLSDGYAFVYADTTTDRPLSRNVDYVGHYVASVLRKAPSRMLAHMRIAKTDNHLAMISCVSAAIKAVLANDGDGGAGDLVVKITASLGTAIAPAEGIEQMTMAHFVNEQLEFINKADAGPEDDDAACAAYIKDVYLPIVKSNSKNKLYSERMIADACKLVTTPILRASLFKLGATGRVNAAYQPYYGQMENWIMWKVAKIYSDKNLNKAGKDTKIVATLTEDVIKAKLTQILAKDNTTLEQLLSDKATGPTSSMKRTRADMKGKKPRTATSEKAETEDLENPENSGTTVSDIPATDLFTEAAFIAHKLKKTAEYQAALFGRLETLLQNAAAHEGDS